VGLEGLVTSFYSQLYSAIPDSPEQLQAEDKILSYVSTSFPTHFFAAVLAHLARPLDKVELKAALDSMATGRSPGPDGILTKFFSKLWEVIGTDLTRMINFGIGSR
jgi:hypothetical protein